MYYGWIERNLKSKNCKVQAPCVCKSLAFHFRPIFGSLPVHLGSIDGHIMCPIIQFFKKIEFRKICGHTVKPLLEDALLLNSQILERASIQGFQNFM